MRYATSLIEGRYIKRLNRFTALVDINGISTLVHVPNSGRMMELFKDNRRVLLEYVEKLGRKTKHDLLLIDTDSTMCSIDSRLPPLLVKEAFQKSLIGEFVRYRTIQQEVKIGDSRIDLLFTGSTDLCYVETKSVNLVDGGVALFPGSPTVRGTKHLRALRRIHALGHRAAMVFVVQRIDATLFRPNYQEDPEFCQELRSAIEEGVEAYAYNCWVTSVEISIHHEIPIDI